MIHYLQGDATRPNQSPAIIAHVCNDIGRWGKGFVLALSKRWKAPQMEFLEWSRAESAGEPAVLGNVQLVQVEDGLWVANMVAQSGIYTRKGVPPIRYGALETCLHKVYRLALERGAGVHMPRIGCGVAGGTWEVVGPLVDKMLVGPGVPVWVYDLETVET